MHRNESRPLRRRTCSLLVPLCMAPCFVAADQQPVPGPESAMLSAQAVSQTGLLPVYGIDFAFDPSWVSSQFPNQSSIHSHFGVNAAFQQVSEALKSSGFGVIRFPVDVRDARIAAGRTANLCMWAKRNNVRLVPILVGAERGQAIGTSFAQNVAEYTSALIGHLRADTERLQAYTGIMAFQLESKINHGGLHGGMSRQTALARVLQTASALRNAEQGALKDTGLEATPLMVDASFDYELIAAGAIGSGSLSESAFAQARESLKQFLREIALAPEIDVVGMEWLPGSLSSGGAEKVTDLVRGLSGDLAGKQLVLATGFSTAFHGADAQKDYFLVTFANLADYRASESLSTPFIGVFFREATNGPQADTPPPTPQVSTQISQWNWSSVAQELTRTWSTGGTPSPGTSWWLTRVENNLGLVRARIEPGGTAAITEQPALQGLKQIAGAVNDANAAVAVQQPSAPGAAGVSAQAPPGIPSPAAVPSEVPPPAAGGMPAGSATQLIEQRLQAGLALLLDKTFERLALAVSGGSSGAGVAPPPPGGYPPGTPPPGGYPPGTTPGGYPSGATPAGGTPSIVLTRDDVRVEPSTPTAGAPVSFNVTLRNSGNTDASGLVVVLVDESSGGLLAPETQVVDVAVSLGSSRGVTVPWTPAGPGSYGVAVKVGDASFFELASVSLGPLSVAPGSGAPTTTAPPIGTTVIVDPVPGGARESGVRGAPIRATLPPGLPQVKGLRLSPATAVPGGSARSAVSLAIANPYSRPLLNVSAALYVDGRAVETKQIGALLPKQSRSVLFSNVAVQQGVTHDLRIGLRSMQPKPVSGSLAARVSIPASVPASEAAGRVRSIVPGVRPGASGQSISTASGQVGSAASSGTGLAASPVRAVRATVPTTFKIGGLRVATSAGRQTGTPATPATSAPGEARSVVESPPSGPPRTTDRTSGVRPPMEGVRVSPPPGSPSGGAPSTQAANVADLAVTVVGATNATVGENVSYTTTVTNSGPQTATSVVVSQTVPAYATMLDIQAPGRPWGCAQPPRGSAGTIICSGSDLPPGGSMRFTAVLLVQPIVAGIPGYRVASSVRSSTRDPNPENNTGEVVTRATSGRGVPSGPPDSGRPWPGMAQERTGTRIQRPDVSVGARDISYPPGPITPGRRIQFTINVHNVGGTVARNVSVRCVLVGDSRAEGSIGLPEVNSGATAPVSWETVVPAGRQWRFEVSVDAGEDANRGNNFASIPIGTAPLPPRRLPGPSRGS